MKLNTWKIKLLMARQELNQSDLAKKCGTTRQALCEILTRGKCTLKTLGRIANALGVDVTEILEEEN